MVERDAVITGLGAVCALAEDCEQLWSAVTECRSGIGPIQRFSTDGFEVGLGALVERCNVPQGATRDLTGNLCRRFATQALREAMRSASLHGASVPPDRIAFVFGTGIADLAGTVHEIAEEVADDCGLGGPRLTISTACSSSTAAIGLGRDLLMMGAADVVIAGGSDVLTPEVFAGFHALGVLSPGKCAPFSRPAGTTLGEGAGFLVLERQTHAASRSAAVLAGLVGYGLSGDGWHETSPDPKGAGVERAIRAALRDATLDAADVEYVNVHGSGTEANDLSEWLGIQRALGGRARAIPVSSTKGALGHAQGAAGVLETIVLLLARARDLVPPTLNFSTPRPHAPPDSVPGPAPRAARWSYALKLNSAFGGSNATLLVSRSASPRPSVQRAPVCLLGFGGVGPNGSGDDAFPTRARGHGEGARVAASFVFEDVLPDTDPRGLDPMSRFLTAAAALSLRDAGLPIRGALRDRTGLFVGQLRGSPASITTFQRSIEERGLTQLSPSAFARIVLNAAAGACSKLLSLRGPLSAFTTGEGSGLAAIVLAAELLGTRHDVDAMVAGGCDEHAPPSIGETPDYDEGAACVALANARGIAHATSPPAAWMQAWAVLGPGQLRAAIERVTSVVATGARISTVRVEDMAAGPGANAALALAKAARTLRGGGTELALVTSGGGRSLCAAVLLGRTPSSA